MRTEFLMPSILETYGSLELPRFEKINARFKENKWGELIDELKNLHNLVERTDLNNDVSRAFDISNNAAHELTLQLSLVGPFAIMFRMYGPITDIFLGEKSDCKSSLEISIYSLVEKFGLNFLSQMQLEQHVALVLFDTEPENVRFYQALFSDTDFMPGEYETSQRR